MVLGFIKWALLIVVIAAAFVGLAYLLIVLT